MARTTVRLSGFRELNQTLNDLGKAAHSGVLRRAGMKAMQPMADIAERLAPDDIKTPPLDLHTSIQVSTGSRIGRQRPSDLERGNRANIYMGPVYDLERYVRAIVMEFGSYKDRPQPYMRPAWEQDKDRVLARLSVELKQEIDRAVSRAARRAARQAAGG